eukprot:CAMPEP_0177668894 /NCGR_PEP_ID=MMETSP0447-20121125/23072_1 /TAXON_ID=0 /ORGANISM="Stygamoeba regulata, Strain BSH-02190019" /LENGTH=86 /DNA_ID=CAMNT_0019175567 /DNA_START=262 /DNA_END=518 /DNA_ORIENTATION=+
MAESQPRLWCQAKPPRSLDAITRVKKTSLPVAAKSQDNTPTAPFLDGLPAGSPAELAGPLDAALDDNSPYAVFDLEESGLAGLQAG